MRHQGKHFETWCQTASRFATRLNDMENESIELMHDAMQRYPEHKRIVLTSTGKDSTVVEHIAKMSGFLVEGQCVFNNTTLDVADT